MADPSGGSRPLVERLRAAWAPFAVLLVVVLLPVGRGSEVAVAIGMLAAFVLLARGRLDWRSDAARLVLALFACYWLPTLVSAFGAVEPGKTWSTVVTTPRLLPFALFTLWALRDAARWPAFVAAVGMVVALWVLDAYVQMATGFSLGGAPELERLSGIFGAGNLKLGQVLATLSPFLLLAARARFGRAGLIVAFVLTIAPVLLSGSRAGWLAFALVGLVLAWCETRDPRRFFVALATLAFAFAAIGTLALYDSARFGMRVERSMLALEGDEHAVDEASAGRVRIWRTALAMAEAHPFNGVGARGFRYAYPRYAASGDRFVDAAGDVGASHAHQIVLEVLSETGLVGVLAWLLGAWLAWRAWRRADAAARERAFAPALALVAMTFPLNTHLAFYSAWWGLLFWWLLALYCAALGARASDTAG